MVVLAHAAHLRFSHSIWVRGCRHFSWASLSFIELHWWTIMIKLSAHEFCCYCNFWTVFIKTPRRALKICCVLKFKLSAQIITFDKKKLLIFFCSYYQEQNWTTPNRSLLILTVVPTQFLRLYSLFCYLLIYFKHSRQSVDHIPNTSKFVKN